MAVKVNTMGMSFDKGTEPNFGSIRLVRTCKNNVREYLLNSADVSKLNSIYNANDGSTAYCVDTGELYIKHIDEWKKVGGASE